MKRQAGYAIAEVLVAVIIISISFIQLSGAVSKIMRNANQTILVGKSIFVANSTLEEVMAQPFDAKGSEANGYALVFDGSGDYVDLGNVFNGVQTISFWLDSDVNILSKRLKINLKRPMLKNGNPEENLKTLYNQRKHIYNLANYKIKCDKLSIKKISEIIISIYEKH